MANVNDVYRISTLGSVGPGGDAIVNTFYYRISVIGTGDERSALVSAFQATGNPMAALAGCLPTAVVFSFVTVQAVKPVGTLLYGIPTFATGNLTGTYLPTQVAVIISRKTATPGRGGRGRLFVGPVPASQQSSADNDKVTTTNYVALGTAMLLNLTASGWTFVPVLWKRKTNVSLDLQSTTVNPVTKTRRSRAEGIRFHRRRKHTVGSI